MKKTILIIAILLPISLFSQQNLVVNFDSSRDTIEAINEKLNTGNFQIIYPKQSTNHKAEISFEIVDSDFGISSSELFLPAKKKITIDTSKADTINFDFKFNLNTKDNRVIKFKLNAIDTLGNAIEISGTSTKTILIRSQSVLGKEKKSYEFWIYTGTNLDLLDGAKPKDLYAKLSYLHNFNYKEKRSRHWIYFVVGSNRFFSDSDTIQHASFSDILGAATDTTFNVERGIFGANRKTETESIFLSRQLLRSKLKSLN